MGAINSVPRWSPFVAPPRALPPTKPPSPRRSRHRGNGGAAGKGGAHNAAEDQIQRDRRMSLSPDAVRDRTYSDGGSVTGMGERSNSKIMGPSAPVLYENALVGEWTSLRTRARTHPSEATYVDRRLNAAIHLVCRRQPTAEVVKALLEADPIGANRVTVDGMTPLHFAAYCGAEVEVIRLLLESAERHPLYSGGGGGLGSTTTAPLQSHNSNSASQSPLPPHKSGFGDNTVTASTTDRRGRTPLHLVLSGFRTPHRPDVVRLLLRSDPSGSTRADERGRTPLSLLYDDYAEEVEDALLLSSSSSSSYGGGDAIDDALGGGVGGGNASEGEDVRRMCLDPDGELNECWTMLNVLLRCAYHGTVPEESAIMKRSASSGGGGDHGDHGEEASEGSVHAPAVAAAAGNATARRISSSGGLSSTPHSQAPAAAQSSREIDLLHGPYRPLHAAVGVYETPPKFVRLILRAYPKSAEEKDSDFNLPLHVAARAVPVSHKRSRGRGGRRGSALASAAAMSATTALRGGGHGIGGSGGGGGSTGVVMRGGRNSLLPSSGSGGTLVASSAGLKAKVYNADFGRSGGSGGHHKSGIGVGDSSSSSLGGGHGFPSASSSAVAAGTRGSGCGGGAAAHTAISDLLHSYPEAASIPDESGRYALILAVQSGKNWDRDVRPILDAYPEAFYGSRGEDVDGEEAEDEEKGRAAVTRALLGALGSPVGEVRAETARTVTGLAHVWLGGEEDKEEGRKDLSRQGDNASSSSASGDDGDGDDSTAFDDAAAFREEDSATTVSNAYADANSYDSPPGEIGRKEGRPLASSSAISLADDLVRLVATGGSNGSAHRKGSDLSASLHGSDDWGAGTVSAALDALAGLYTNIPRKCLNLPASAEAGSDVAMDALRHDEEEVRESAARCLGAALELQGDEAVLAAMADLLSQHRAGRGGRQGGMGGPPGGRGITRRFSGSALSVAESIASTITGEAAGGGGGRNADADDNEESRTDDESDLEEYSSPPSRHGRAAAAYRILLSPSAGATVAKDAETFRGSTRLIRDLVLDDDVAVRRAACLAAGAALRRGPDPTSTLRELRRAMKKCMRATEEATVHACLARGLISACGNDAKPTTRGGAGGEGGSVFLCKAGMPILDGALMLAVGSAAPPHVQRMFHGFLWLALGVGDARGGTSDGGNNNNGLERYKRLAEGENGRIMMTLVNKTLSKIERVEEGDGGR